MAAAETAVVVVVMAAAIGAGAAPESILGRVVAVEESTLGPVRERVAESMCRG